MHTLIFVLTGVDENPHRESCCFRENVSSNGRFTLAVDATGLDFESLKLLCSILKEISWSARYL